MNGFLAFLGMILTAQLTFANQPNPNLTPGLVCTPQDRDFSMIAYPAHVALCQRNVSTAEKTKVAAAYGVPPSNWRNVEFDHLIPLCAGGSNDIRNIWPEALDHAHLKDRVEDQVCAGLRNGTLNQKQAIDIVFQWLRTHPYE